MQPEDRDPVIGDALSDISDPTNNEEANAETDSDVDLPPPDCPLCSVDEVLPETASTVVSDNAYMRRIMAQE